MKIILGILLVLSLLIIPRITLAHGGQARLELDVTQASPTATIALRGTGFEPHDTVTLWLVGSSTLWLGTVNADIGGDFDQRVLLPGDLAFGIYEIRGADAHHVVSVPLNIVPDADEVEKDQREEQEPLLAPMPTGVSNTARTDRVPSNTSSPSLTKQNTATTIPPTFWFASTALMIIVGVGIAIFLRRRR